LEQPVPSDLSDRTGFVSRTFRVFEPPNAAGQSVCRFRLNSIAIEMPAATADAFQPTPTDLPGED